MVPVIQHNPQEAGPSHKRKKKSENRKSTSPVKKSKTDGADTETSAAYNNQVPRKSEPVVKKKTAKNFGKGKKKSGSRQIQRKNAKPSFLKKLEDLSASDIDSDEDFGMNGPEFGPLSDTSSSDYENQEEEDLGQFTTHSDGWNGVPSNNDEQNDGEDDEDLTEENDEDDDDDDGEEEEGSDDEGSSSGESVPEPEGLAEGSEDEEEAAEKEKEDPKKHPKFDSERESRTVFVGNLPCSVKKMKVLKWFSKFGKVECVRLRCAPIADPEVPKKVSAMQKNFHESRTNINAFVRFVNIASVDKAVEANGAEWDEDHHLRIDRAVAGKKHDDKKAVFLGNLPFDVEEELIRQLFVDCGDVEDVRIVRDKKTNVGKGFAFVNFAGRHSVALALAKNGELIGKRPVRVQRCNYKESKYDSLAPSSKDPKNRFKKPQKGELKRLQHKKKSVSKDKSATKEKFSFQGEQAKKREKRMKRKKNLKKNKKEKFVEVLNSKTKKPKPVGVSI